MYESLVLKFGKSTSQNYPYAVEVASEFNTYRESGEGRSITHTVAFTSDQINDFFDFYDLVGRWKSCRIYIDGEFVPPNRRGFLWCFREGSMKSRIISTLNAIGIGNTLSSMMITGMT